MRPIDADAIKEKFAEILESTYTDDYAKGYVNGLRAALNMPTLTPPNEWVSVEERLPEDEARQYIEDDLGGIGYLYPCLLTYKSPNTERIHVVRFYYDIIQKWFVNNGEELCEKGRCIAWMPLPAPPDRRPPEAKDNNVPTDESLTLEQLRASPHGKIKDSTLQSICNRANEIACRPPEGEEDT